MICKEKADFLAKVTSFKQYKILGLDFGERKIGTGIYDSRIAFAMPYNTIKRKNIEYDIKELLKIIKDNNISGIVIGMPYDLKGRKGKAAEKVDEFCEILNKFITIPISFEDERFTTAFANTLLKEVDLNRKKRDKVDDQLAACIILNSFLNAVLSPI